MNFMRLLPKRLLGFIVAHSVKNKKPALFLDRSQTQSKSSLMILEEVGFFVSTMSHDQPSNTSESSLQTYKKMILLSLTFAPLFTVSFNLQTSAGLCVNEQRRLKNTQVIERKVLGLGQDVVVKPQQRSTHQWV